MGFQLRKSTVIDLRGETVHPLAMAYTAVKLGAMPTLLMDIPTSRCRTQLWNTLEAGRNPFVKTIIEYGDNKSTRYQTSALKTYYNSYVPRNAAEVIRLNNHQMLKQIPPGGYILPWDNQSVEDTIKIRERVAQNENRKEGNQMGLWAGHTDFGPVNDQKGEIEFSRLVKISDHIKKQGFIEKPYMPDGGIKGYFLIGENDDWCFIVKSGKHRAYALSALGYTSIPVVLDAGLQILKRTHDLSFWPQVRNGVFSEKEASTVANNILDVEHESAKN